MRMNVPDPYKGPDAIMPSTTEEIIVNKPRRRDPNPNSNRLDLLFHLFVWALVDRSPY